MQAVVEHPTTRVKPPITYLGSKAGLAEWICSHFPEHTTYVEPYGGSAAVLLAKQPSKVEVYNDINQELVILYRVLRDKAMSERLYESLSLTLYSRAEFDYARRSVSIDPVEIARCFIVKQCQSHCAHGRRFSFVVKDSCAGNSSAVQRWLRSLARIQDVHERMRHVQIECLDALDIVKKYDTPDTLFYLDPPYVAATRVSGQYKHELDDSDHVNLITALLDIKGKAILSGYEHQIYKPLQHAGWTLIKKEVTSPSSPTRNKRIECLWISPGAHQNRQMGIFDDYDIGSAKNAQ
jgi:DNA adenine methylase